MNSAELKNALETIVANFPNAKVNTFSDGGVNVMVGVDYRGLQVAEQSLVEIRAKLAAVDTGFKFTKKMQRHGHWNMGVFVTDELSRRFIPA